MRILAIETATSEASVAFFDGERTQATRLPSARDHGKSLAGTVQALAGDQLERIDGFALAIGPGSFTGLRVGLSFLKGLALVIPRPVAPISTLALIAARARTAVESPVLAVLDARAGEVFARLDPGLPEGLYRGAEVAAALQGLAPGRIAGEDVPALRAALPDWRFEPPDPTPLSEVLAALAVSVLEAGAGVDVQPLEPAYLQLAAVDRRHRSVTDPTPLR